MKVALGLPVLTDPKARFTLSLIELLAWSLTRRVTYNDEVVTPAVKPLMVTGCSRIDLAREIIAERAVADGDDYVLWLDSDQVFPPHALMTLAAHDLPIVGCNYRQKDEAAVISTAAMIVDGRLSPIEPKPDGLEPVDVLGLGVCLMKTELFRRLPRPWFKGGGHGEDGNFCQLAKAHGIQPYVDHALSREVGHIAEAVLTFPA